MASDQQPQTYRETATTHIRALSTLSTRLPPILTASATTLSQLTNAPVRPSATTPDTPAARRALLSTSANDYFTAVLDLAKALHEQIGELEKHGVIPAEEAKYRAPPSLPQVPGAQGHVEKKDSEAAVTNGGLGDFDVGVLNARAGVRRRGDEETLERAKRVLEELAGKTGGAEDERMDVDG